MMYRRYALSEYFTFSSVSKKIFFLSKILGVAIIALYNFSANRLGGLGEVVFYS